MNPVEYYKRNGWYVTSPYGQRTGQYAGFHRGVDFGGKPCGADVKTPYSGVVVAAKTSGMGTWGNTVCIELDPDGQYVSLNAHLQTIIVREGQRVVRGDLIGTNGGTNHSGSNYACHIHYEIQKNNGSAPWRGTHIDPAKFELQQNPQEPSDKFFVGEQIKNTASSNVNVRQAPATNQKIVGQVSPGQVAQIVRHADNGVKVGNYYWWYIGYGWVAEDFFALDTPPDPEPVKPPELVEVNKVIEFLKKIVKMIEDFLVDIGRDS